MFIQGIQNQMQGKNGEAKGPVQPANPDFHYEIITDMTDMLLSVYELTSLSEEIYFEVNQNVTSIFARIGIIGFIKWKAVPQPIEICPGTPMRPLEPFF